MDPDRRIIFLTGAPEAETLDWNNAGLLSNFTLWPKPASQVTQYPQPTLSWQPPKWRHLPTTTARLRPLQTQTLSFDPPNQIPDLALAERGENEVRQEFFEHSLAILDGLLSSQISATGIDDSALLDPTNATITSFNSSISNGTDTSPQSSDSTPNLADPTPAPPPAPQIGPVTDLRSIPSAPHIQSIVPQTLTVNLIAAVITVVPARRVVLRRSRNPMDIVEVLLGDETRAGFSVSFWFAPDESQPRLHRQGDKERDLLREAVGALRPGDVIGFVNVALAAFRGLVFGQSLGGRFRGNCTRVVQIESTGGGGGGGLAGKVARVREWSGMFVGSRRGNKGMGGIAGEGDEEELPPDSFPVR